MTRRECVFCHRRVGMSRAWNLARHKDGTGEWCLGGGTSPYESPAVADNTTDGVTGGGWGSPARDRQIGELADRLCAAQNRIEARTGYTEVLSDEFFMWLAEELVDEPIGRAQPSGPTEELAQWWRDTAEAEISMVCAKAIEYSATDLRDLGRQLAEMAGRINIYDADAVELGIAFYAAGKVARIMGAVKEGRRPLGDSWLDLGVYARMAQRVHQTGGWPGTPNEPSPYGDEDR